MPTYDYECGACGHKFEEFQSIMAGSRRKCPKCRKSKLRRLIGAGAGVIFRGSGFYQTDHRSESYKKSAEKDKPATEKSGGESKPAAATGGGESKAAPAKTAEAGAGKRASQGDPGTKGRKG